MADELPIISPLPLVECQKRLRANVAEPPKLTGEVPADTRFLGRIEGTEFSLLRHTPHRRAFPPVLHGQLHAEGNGTRLEGSFGLHPFFKLVLFAWLAFAGWKLLEAMTGDPDVLAARLELPGLMFLFAVLVVGAARLTRRKEERDVVAELRKLLADSRD